MSNGTDPLLEAMRNGTVKVPGATRENLVAARTVAFPFKKLGKYDKNITSAIYEGALNADPYMEQEYYRGAMQSGAKKMLNGIVSRGASIVPKVGQGFGHVLGTGAAILSGDAFQGDWSLAYDNKIANAFANMDEGLKKMAPVYMSQQYGEGNLLQKMGTATFWASDFADGLAFLASAYVPGAAIGKLGSVIKGTSKLRMLQGLKAAGLTSDDLIVGASSIYNTVSEAGVEAYHVNKDLRQQLMDAGVSEEEARMRAGEAAAETFGLNMATLWLSNIPQSKWFHGNVGTRHKVLKELVKDGKATAEKIGSKYSWWKSALKGVTTEGLWEENLQTAIERYEKRFANGETDADWLSGVATEAWTNVRGFLKTISPFHDAPAAGSPEDEGATAIALGALIGAPMASYSEFREYIADQKELANIKKWWDQSLDYTGMGLKAFHEDVKAPYREFTKTEEQTDENGNTKDVTRTTMLNAQNRTEVSPNKMANIMMRHLTNKKYFDESVIAAIENDEIHDNFNKHMGFASFIYSLYSNPNLSEDDIVQAIQQAIKNSSEETDELGVNQFIQDNIRLAESYFKDLKVIDEQVSGEYDFKEDPAAQSFKKNLMKSLLYAKVKSRVSDEIMSSADAESALFKSAENIKKDADEFIEGAKKHKDKIWKAYSKFYEDFNNATKEEENLDDVEQYKKNYWARELAQTLSITNVEHPQFWSAEPLTTNQNARKSSIAEPTVREKNAADRGQMYLGNKAVQDAVDNNLPASQIVDQLDRLPEVLPATANKVRQLSQNLQQKKDTNSQEIDRLAELVDAIRFGEADIFLEQQLGPEYTEQDVDDYIFGLEEESSKLFNENQELTNYQNNIEKILGSDKKLQPNKNPYQIQFLNAELAVTDSLIQAFERNPEEFARLQEVLTEIKRVNTLIDFFKSRKDLNKRIRDRALVLLQQRLNRLNKAEKVASENMKNKSKANLIKEQQKTRSLLAVFGHEDDGRFIGALPKIIDKALSESEFDSPLTAWAAFNDDYTKQDGTPYTNSYAAVLSLIDAIRESDSKNEVISEIKANYNILIDIFKGKAKGIIKTTLDNYKRSPHQWIYTILSSYAQKELGLSNIFKDTSLPFYQWKKTNDAYALREALKNMPNMSTMYDLITLHISITSTQTVLDYLQATESYKDIYEQMDKAIGDLTPSLEQSMAATEIVGALLSPMTGGLYDDATYLRGPAGSGKALPNYVEVYNEEGPIQIGDIKIGNTIFGKNSLTKVIGVYPQGKKKVVELIFSDGRTVECCEDHLWDFYINRVGGCNTTTLPTKYIDPSKNEFFLPQHSALKFSKKELPLPPYLLGLLLGDGCLRNGSINLSTADKEIIDYLFEVTKDTNITPKHISNYDWRLSSPRGESNYILEAIKDLGLRVNSHNKFIPKEYLFSSIEDRIELLKGLMDTDGTVDKRYGSTEYYTTSEQLAKDFQFLLNSLGVNGSIATKETTHKLCYRIKPTFLDFCPFNLKRKVKYFKETKWPRHIKLVSVNYTDREEEMTCIKVDAKDQLFLVDQFVLTHNTTVTANLVMKTFMKLAGITKDQIVVSGHKHTSADKVAAELGTKATYLENLIGMNLNTTRLIIIDEAAGMTPVQANEVMSKVQEHNKSVSNPKEKVRIFLLGDPSQITRQAVPVALQSGHIIEPITTVFRTSIGTIEHTFMEYKDNPNEVHGLTTQSSHSLIEAKSNNESLFGVMTGGPLDMIDVIKARQQGDGRRRVIIVNNEGAKAPYEGIPGVEVLTYEEVQGETIDEIYIDMNPSKNNFEGNQFADTLEFNTAVYTALSRAKYFAYSTIPGMSSVKSNSVNEQTTSNKDLFEAIKEQYNDYFNAHKYFFEKFNGKTLDVKNEIEEVDDATPTESVEEEVPEEEPTSPPLLQEKKESESFPQKEAEEIRELKEGMFEYSHYLYYPDNSAIGTWINDPNSNVQYTGKGYIIKSASSNDRKYTLSVIAERNDGTYDVVGVLSNKDFTDGAFGNALTKEWNKIWKDPKHPLGEAIGGNTTSLPITSKKIGLVPGKDFNMDLTVMPLTVEKIQPLEPVIDPEKRFRDMGPGFLERLLTEVYRNVFKGSKLGADPSEKVLIPTESGTVDLNQLYKQANKAPNSIRVERFTNKTAQNVRGNFKPKPGRTYLVIENMNPEGSSGTSNPFFIPLANLPFSKDSYYYKPIRDFYDALVKAEDALGLKLVEGLLEDIVREMAKSNFKGTWNEETEKYEILAADKPKTFGEIISSVPGASKVDSEALAAVAAELETLIRLGFGVQWRYVTMTKEEFDNSEYANNDLYFWEQEVDAQKNFKETGKVKQKTRDAASGQDVLDTKNFPREYVLVPNQGKTQKALDELARENEFIGDKRLRIATLTDRKKSKLHIMSRTLFRKKEEDEYKYIYGLLRQIHKDHTGDSLPGRSGLTVRDIVLEKGFISEEELRELEKAHYTPPITREILADIVDFQGQYHQTSSSQGPRYLREPISGLYDFNLITGNNLQSPQAREIIESKLASKVLTINPLSVKISIQSDKVEGETSNYAPKKSELGSPLNEELFSESTVLEDTKKAIKEGKRKDGWIPKKKLDNIVGDMGAALDLVDSIIDETDKSVKLDENKIKLTDTTPTVGQEPVTEEDLIKAIKGISEEAWKEIEPVIKGKSDAQRLAVLLKLFRVLNKKDLNDDIRFAHDQNRMKGIADALGKKLTEKQAKKLLNRLLPGLELTPEQVRFVSKEVLQSMAKPGEDLWGLWDKGVIYLAYTERNGEKVFYENVIRHEVFHRIHQTHMSQAERENLRKLVDAKYGTKDLSNYDYEEWLARKYQSWRAGTFKVRGFLRSWMKWVQRLFDFIFSNRNQLEELFNRIDYGFYTPSTYLDSSYANRQAMKFIKEQYGKMDVFKEAINIVKKGFNKYLYIDPKLGGGKNGLVVSEAEALTLLRRDLDDALRYRKEVLQDAKDTMELFPEGSVMHESAKTSIPSLELRVGALEALTSPPKKGKKSPYRNLIDYLYPNSIYLDEAENALEEEDNIVALEEVLEGNNDTGVAAQIEENETKNHELKLSSSMRHWLSSIMSKTKDPKTGEVNDTPVSDRYAYFQMLQFFQVFDLNNITYELKDLYAQKQYILENNSLGAAGKMVLERIAQTIEEAVKRVYGPNNIPIPNTQNIVLQHNELTGKTTFYFIEGKDANKYTFYDEVKDRGEITVYSLRGEELAPIYNVLRREGILDSKDLFNALYKRTIARDIVRTAQNNFKMKEMDILIASQVSDFGKTYTRYIKGRTLGLHTSLRSSFKNALYRYVELGMHTSPSYKAVETLLKSGDYLGGIKKFLNQLGLSYLTKDFQTGNLKEISDTILNTLGEAKDKKLTNEWVERTVTDPVTNEEEKVLVDPIQEWLDDNDTIVTQFIESLKFNFEWLRNTSVRSGDKKKLYKFSNSSYMHDLFHNLINAHNFKGSDGNQVFRKLPEYLQTSFFQNNPYVSGLAKLYEMNYHDTFRNEYSQSVKSYDRENKAEWLRREFVFGFINGLATSKSREQSYHQFTYPLSDRTRIPVFRTRFYSQQEAKEAIKMAILQIRNRNRNLSFFKGYDHLNNTNFTVYDPKTMNKMAIDDAVAAVYQKLIDMGKETASTIINEEVVIPTDLHKAVEKAQGKWKGMRAVPKEIKYRQDKKYTVNEDVITDLAQAYEVNTYLNSYFLTQLFAGDQAFYGDSVKVVKRGAGPSAPGTALLVNDEFGMKAKARVAIVNDKTIKFSSEDENVSSIEKFLKKFLSEEEFEQVKNYFSRKGFDMTDAQGFITPERMNDLRRGVGTAYGLGNIIKPVYFSIQTKNIIFSKHPYDTKEQAQQAADTHGRTDLIVDQDPTDPSKYSLFTKEAFPVYFKYSAINLSNELIKQFPYLQTIRDKMEKQSIDEMIFSSAVKVGKPSILSNAEDVEIESEDFTFSNIMELDNEHFRLQLNPRHDPNDKVSMFTQLTYFLNVFNVDPNKSNNAVASKVYNAIAFLTKKGLENFNTSARRPTSLAKRLLDTPGYESALELLEAGVSIDNPAIEKLLVTQFAAKMSNDTVNRIKFPGGKYTLQSAYGVYKNKLKVGQVPTEADELQYRVNDDGSMYAEMILPKGVLSVEQEAAIMQGDELFLHGDGFAFRIPSTELHSAISIKVVGIYDDLKTNVIIGPKELVPLHGSDFDADSLSVILRSRMSSDFKFHEIDLKDGEFIGYINNNKGQYVLDDGFPLALANSMDQAKLQKDNKALNQLRRIEDEYVKNLIAESMMEIIRNPQNRPRMLTPISMERFNGEYGGESMKLLLMKAGDPDPQKKYDISSSAGRFMAYKSIFDGAALTGVFANGIKSLAYLVKSGPTQIQKDIRDKISNLKELHKLSKDPNEKREITKSIKALEEELIDMKYKSGKALPYLKKNFRVSFDGFMYDQLSELERDINDPTKFSKTSIWETMDALVNSAIDNANEQILFMIGANNITANAFTSMVGMGVPLKTIVFFLRQPIIKELSKSKYRGRAELGIRDLREMLEGKAKEIPSDENIKTSDLSKYIKDSDYEINWDELSSEDAQHYLKVLNQFEKVWGIGKSLETMATYLNIVREMPVTAETMGKMREIINEIGQFDITVSKDDYYHEFQKGGSFGTLLTNDNFALDIPNFIKNNPHIAIAHQAFERLEQFIESTFFVHSSVVKSFINNLGLTGQIALAKGDRESAILNKIEFAREFQKYLMSSIYKDRFEKDIPKYYYTNYKGEQEYLEGSKAWFQHFISKIEAIQKYLQKEAGSNEKLTNYFLFNLSVSGNELRSVRYTAGSNLKYEDTILARDAFEELNKYDIKETLIPGMNPKYEVIKTENPPRFTEFQKDFIVFSILNNGLQYSITSLSQVLPPVLFKQSDDILQQLSNYVRGNEQSRKNIKDHFKLSMVAANADQLSWISRKSKFTPLFLQEEKTRHVILKGNKVKAIIDTTGELEGNYYDIAFENKLEDKEHSSKEFPKYIRTSEGRTAVAYLRMNDPKSDVVMYQRIGKNPSGFYELPDLSEEYVLGEYYNLKIPTVHSTNINEGAITVDRSLSYIPEGTIIALVDFKDISRKNRRFVKIVSEAPKTEQEQYRYMVTDAFENKNEETEYFNNLFAEDDTRETYEVTVFGEKGFLKTSENKVTDAPLSIAKFVIGKDITEATMYIKENDGELELFEKKCKKG